MLKTIAKLSHNFFVTYVLNEEIAKKIRGVADKYKKLEMAEIWWAKNSSKNTLEISRIFGNLVNPLAAVQSMDSNVLKIIKRDNIQFSTMTDLLDTWKKDHIKASTDVLVGLPGESLESHLDTLRKVFELDFEIKSEKSTHEIFGIPKICIFAIGFISLINNTSSSS